jgi:hypothetical protein
VSLDVASDGAAVAYESDPKAPTPKHPLPCSDRDLSNGSTLLAQDAPVRTRENIHPIKQPDAHMSLQQPTREAAEHKAHPRKRQKAHTEEKYTTKEMTTLERSLVDDA